MRYGYARVSTAHQKVQLQCDALGGAGCQRIFKDEGVSGAVIERPALGQLLTLLQRGDQVVGWRG